MIDLETATIDLKILNEFGGVKSIPDPTPHHLLYLVQTLACDLRYRHSWYGHPYSSGLNKILVAYFDNKDDYDEQITKIELNSKTKQNLFRVEKILRPPSNISEDKWSELLCSIHYYRNICCVKGDMYSTFLSLGDNRRFITREDKNRGFTLEEFKLAWNRLKDFHLLNKKHNRPS